MEAETAPSIEGAATALQADTLRKDIRNLILTEFKHAPGAWPKLSEGDQQRLISRAEDIAGTLVRRAIDVVAERGLPALPVEVGKMKVDGRTVKADFECYADDDNLLRMRHMQGTRAMLVLASPDRFNATNGEKEPEPDNVGDLGIPKGDGERPDADALAAVGRGKGGRKKKGQGESDPVKDAATLAAEGTPSTAPNDADTADPAFQIPEDA